MIYAQGQGSASPRVRGFNHLMPGLMCTSGQTLVWICTAATTRNRITGAGSLAAGQYSFAGHR
jgi:hypothetical protein